MWTFSLYEAHHILFMNIIHIYVYAYTALLQTFVSELRSGKLQYEYISQWQTDIEFSAYHKGNVLHHTIQPEFISSVSNIQTPYRPKLQDVPVRVY